MSGARVFAEQVKEDLKTIKSSDWMEKLKFEVDGDSDTNIVVKVSIPPGIERSKLKLRGLSTHCNATDSPNLPISGDGSSEDPFTLTLHQAEIEVLHQNAEAQKKLLETKSTVQPKKETPTATPVTLKANEATRSIAITRFQQNPINNQSVIIDAFLKLGYSNAKLWKYTIDNNQNIIMSLQEAYQGDTDAICTDFAQSWWRPNFNSQPHIQLSSEGTKFSFYPKEIQTLDTNLQAIEQQEVRKLKQHSSQPPITESKSEHIAPEGSQTEEPTMMSKDAFIQIIQKEIDRLNKKNNRGGFLGFLGFFSIGTQRKVSKIETALESAKTHFQNNVTINPTDFLNHKEGNNRSLSEALNNPRFYPGSAPFTSLFSPLLKGKTKALDNVESKIPGPKV